MTLDRCKEETTFWDFLGWIEFFKQQEEEQLKRVEKQDFYLAQIALEIRRGSMNTKNPSAAKLSDFFVKIKEESSKKNLTKEERTAIAKKYWMKAVPKNLPKGMKAQKPPKKRNK